MIITISGVPGSGKSSVGKEVARRLRYKYISIGALIRDEAKRRGEPLRDLMRDTRTFAAIQRMVESKLDNYGEQDDLVIDGRDAFYHIRRSLKVLLTVDPTTAAQRIHDDHRDTERYASVEQAAEELEERRDGEQVLYQKMHKIDVYDPKHYDLVIDTTNLSVEEVTEQIVRATT